MSKTPNYDAAVKKILDPLVPGERVCALTGEKWMMTEEEIGWYKKFNVPPCLWHPMEQMKFLNGFNTGMAVFWKEDIHGSPTLSSIHPDSPIKIMKDSEWYANDMKETRIEINNQPVIEQLWDLLCQVPMCASRSIDCENSTVVGSVKAEDCYLVNANFSKRCFYSYIIISCEDTIDAVNAEFIIKSLGVAGSKSVSNGVYIFESRNIINSAFLFDCWNCENCFGAANRRNKKYLWWDEQLTKEEWQARFSTVDLSDEEQMSKYRVKFFGSIVQKAVWPETFSFFNEQSEGERLSECIRCDECFWQNRAVDCFRSRFGLENNGCMYGSGNGWSVDSYMCVGELNSNHNKFCFDCKGIDLEYCIFCIECENCFGCVGLKHARFFIFNKVYSELEYWKKLDELKCLMLEQGDYGKFFPAKFALSGFQFSTGEAYIGYSKEDLRRYNAPVFDPARGQLLANSRINEKTINVSEIPKRLAAISADSFVNVPLFDPEIGRVYSVTSSEFFQYQKNNWPFPRRHFVSRLIELIRFSNSPLPEKVVCEQCRKTIITYKNYRFSIRRVYCHDCYLKYLEENN